MSAHRHLALLVNIRLGWKDVLRTNAKVYICFVISDEEKTSSMTTTPARTSG